MYIHYIILGSSYETGTRIALDIVSKENLDVKKVNSIKEYLKNKCLSNSLSNHLLPSKDNSFVSVQKYDPFFENVKLIETKEEFARLVNKDRYIDGYDVARYIMSKIPCTHLKVQKLAYLCYADYLVNYNEPLFKDVIFAFEKGPVIQSIYKVLKKSKERIKFEDDSDMYSKQDRYLPIKRRIIASENGVDKVFSIDRTIEKYGHLKSDDLVKLTHKENSPWSHSGKGLKRYKRIKDDVIKKYHFVEEI